jgi:Uma2 family endonuclease
VDPARRRATYDDLLEVPDHFVAEIIDGDLYATPRPASPHARAGSVIGVDIGGPFDRPTGAGGPGGWWILDEPELHLGADVVVPDLTGWRRERLATLPNVAFFEQAPDWVCEIVSPTTAALDRRHKIHIYSRAHVAHLWLVDPLAKMLEVYRREGDHWMLAATHAAGELIHAEPFEAIEIALGRWWLTA